MKNTILALMSVMIFVSCSKNGDNRIAEQENIRANEQVEAQNENQNEWAQKMEKDLNERKFFIRSIEGVFAGEMSVGDMDFLVKAEMVSSLPIVFSDRTRTLSEINYELENLALNLHVKLENPRVPNSAVSCTIEGFKPDIKKGLIKIISESCKNIFKLYLTDDLSVSEQSVIETRARILAQSARLNEITQIDFLSGTFESSVSTKEYAFKLQRN
jgi:hypothetical protein